MKNKLLATLGAATLALSMSTTASFAGYFQPGETMGVSLASPLPEGIFFADLETYGRSDKIAGAPDAHVGANIPVIIWSTPWSLYNNKLEVIAGFPFAHLDANTGVSLLDKNLNFVGASAFGIGPIIARDFGNGLTGGLVALVRTPTASQNLQNVDGRTILEADFRQSLKYVFGASAGAFSGITIIENAGVSTAFGQSSYRGPQGGPLAAIGGNAAQNDMFAGDFAIEKSFGKVTVGFTGFGNIDLDNRAGSRIVLGPGGIRTNRQASVELGGLIAYDFGRFSLTGIVTRTVYENAAGLSANLSGLVSGSGYETRGWVRAIIPLYIAPTAAPVVARY